MSEAPVRLPGFWRFLWLFWMQPITLHRLLRSLEIDPTAPGGNCCEFRVRQQFAGGSSDLLNHYYSSPPQYS